MDTSPLALTTAVQPTVQPPDAAAAAASDAPAGIEAADFAAALEKQIGQLAPSSPLVAGEADDKTAADGERLPARPDAAGTPDGIIALISAPLMLQAPGPAPDAAGGNGAAPPADLRSLRGQAAGAAGAEAQTGIEPAASAASRGAAFEAGAAREASFEIRSPEGDRPPAAPHVLDAPQAAAPGFSASVAPHAQVAEQGAIYAGRHVAPPVGAAGWDDAFARQVTLIVKDGEQTAQLRLDPPDLGPLEVRISMATDREGVAHAHFVSAHASVRDAIESALPQLRAVLADSGITLGQASVGEGFVRDDARESAPRSSGARSGEAGGDGPDPSTATSTVKRGLVDTFA